MVIGYTTGVFDLFHHGHVNLLRNAKSLCDKLIVGVTTDDQVLYKGKKSIIKYEDRLTVVKACRYVDVAIPQSDHDKVAIHDKLKYDRLFVGSDWYGNDKWISTEKILKERGVKVIYFPYTESVSSTMINNLLSEKRDI